MANNGQHHEFIEFVCKPIEDLYISTNERRTVRIPAGTEYRCSMLREQHFSSLFRHYGKHNGVDKETLVFFFTEELMRELEPNDTPKSVHLKKNDVIVIRHRRKPQPDGLCVRLDLTASDALDLVRAFPRARSLQSADGRAALHHVAARAGQHADVTRDLRLATDLLVLGCDPRTLDNYGRTAADVAKQHRQRELAELLAPNEFKKQMAVIRAHFLGGAAYHNTAPPASSSSHAAAASSQNAAAMVSTRSSATTRRAAAPGNDALSSSSSSAEQRNAKPAGGPPPLSAAAAGPHPAADAMDDDDDDDDDDLAVIEAAGPRVPTTITPRQAPDIMLKRPCPSWDGDASSASHEYEDKYHSSVRFLFSALAHGNQARNFKRVVCFLYA